MTKLRAGLVGLGMMGRNHARILQNLDGVELVVASDAFGDAHSALGDVRLVQTVAELIDVGVDYCVVAVPTAEHERVGMALAEAGVHALVEKPLAHDLASARRLADAFEQRGLIGGVGHIERYNPALQSARVRIEAGDLGDVYQIVTRRQGPFPARIADVGVVKDLATHDIDLTAWVSQQPFDTVAAQVTHRSGREHEDLVAITGSLRDGTVTNHLVNWLSPLKERITIITGERGTFVADTLSADLTYYANASTPTTWADLAQFRGVSEGDMIRYAIPKPEPLRSEHEAFRDAVVGVGTRIVTMAEGLSTVEVAEAVLLSASEGRAVKVGTRG